MHECVRERRMKRQIRRKGNANSEFIVSRFKKGVITFEPGYLDP